MMLVHKFQKCFIFLLSLDCQVFMLHVYTGLAKKNCTLRQSTITFFWNEITLNFFFLILFNLKLILKFLPFLYDNTLRSCVKFY